MNKGVRGAGLRSWQLPEEVPDAAVMFLGAAAVALAAGGIAAGLPLQHLILAALTFACWLILAERLPGTPVNAHYTFALLVLSAALRALALRLRIELLAAVSLTLDAYAIAVMCGVHRRQQPLSSKRSAWLLAASLPLERALQSLIGDSLLRAPVASFSLPSRFPAS